jgi:hypothetical protein
VLSQASAPGAGPPGAADREARSDARPCGAGEAAQAASRFHHQVPHQALSGGTFAFLNRAQGMQGTQARYRWQHKEEFPVPQVDGRESHV